MNDQVDAWVDLRIEHMYQAVTVVVLSKVIPLDPEVKILSSSLALAVFSNELKPTQPFNNPDLDLPTSIALQAADTVADKVIDDLGLDLSLSPPWGANLTLGLSTATGANGDNFSKTIVAANILEVLPLTWQCQSIFSSFAKLLKEVP